VLHSVPKRDEQEGGSCKALWLYIRHQQLFEVCTLELQLTLLTRLDQWSPFIITTTNPFVFLLERSAWLWGARPGGPKFMSLIGDVIHDVKVHSDVLRAYRLRLFD
jgi:hypothetical protein